ncbi:Crp/Fnr family transcriptional regulator [Actinoplanes sp. NPDC023801]|uniref:Crp/Fnr family transcriptional regulator n=1 Tax=Actinoplanes sp. NPDC023801 TaxID=3154595 RepID=UPI0033D42E2D
MGSLASVPALRALAPGALVALAARARPARFTAGTVLRPAGEVARSVVFLLSGTVVATHVGPAGTEIWPEQWTGPAVVDKAAVLDGGPPATGLTAFTAISVRLLDRAGFLDLLEREPSVRTHVLAQLARDAMAGRRRLIHAVTLPAVAQVALWLARPGADPDVVWRGTQEQLAHLLGLSRVTVNRALARLVRAGAIELTVRGVVVTDRSRLVVFAGDAETPGR